MALTLSIHHLPSVPSRELYLLLLSQAGFNTQSAGASAKNLLMSTISHDVTRVRFKAVTDERWVLEPWAEVSCPPTTMLPLLITTNVVMRAPVPNSEVQLLPRHNTALYQSPRVLPEPDFPRN